jgi:homoserine kinase
MYKIISPASSANIGPGFDCLGVCLSMANSMVFSEFEDAVVINNHADTIRNKENLIIKSLFAGCEILGIRLKGVKLDVKTEIPLSRGLGSSASCICAGVAAAFLFAGMPLKKNEIFEIAAHLEGHADNVAPNLYGGLTLSYNVDGKYRCERYQMDEKYQFLACIPDFKLSTRKAREVLPEQYPREDIVFNMTRVGILLGALQTGNQREIAVGLQDKLHQPYRLPW